MGFDAELIRALHADGRASVQALARHLGEPRAAVSNRLRALLTEGGARVVAAVDPGFFGQHVLAHLSIRAARPVEQLAQWLRGRSETVLVSAIGGAHDLVTEVRVGSMPQLESLLTSIRKRPGVAQVSTVIYTTVIKGFFVSEYSGDTPIDETDIALIELLQRDGRMSYRALGESVRLSPSAVATRVQRLISGGVIKISTVEARGLAHRQLSMGVGLNLAGDDTPVMEGLRAWQSVDFAARALGRFDAVATLVEPTAGALFASLERIRSLPGVTRVETWTHLAVLKEDYARTLRPAPAR
jgi:DNA-binding Lrp family transcriptional regulator